MWDFHPRVGPARCRYSGQDPTSPAVARQSPSIKTSTAHAPRPQGGDHRSHRIEAHAEEILALVDETPDITLGEIAAHLDAGHGLTVAQSTVWRLLDRHGMTFKKNRARLRATAS